MHKVLIHTMATTDLSHDDTDITVELSDRLQIVDKKDVKPKLYKFDSSSDIYDIISYFLEITPSNEPFYIVDLGEAQRKYQQWKLYLPRVQPFYAIKSNPDPMLLHILAKLGCGFDCASKDEIILAKATGVPPEKLLYANPVKNNESLQYARSQDVDYLTFDSCCELDKIKLFHPDANCIIRIKVDDSGSVCRFNSKFGCSLEEAKELLELAKIDKVNVVGVSFHCGSNCKKAGQFMSAIADARKIFEMGSEYGFKMNILDIGGGFPAIDDGSVTFEAIADEINAALDKYFGDLENVAFIAEPGRAFSASSHTLVTTIIGIKSSFSDTKEEIFKYTLNDGVYGSFNCIIFDHAEPIVMPFNERTERRYHSVLFGPSCDSIDVITKDAMLPKLGVGDRVFVKNFGAYTKASSSSFNGFKTTLNYYIIKQ